MNSSYTRIALPVAHVPFWRVWNFCVEHGLEYDPDRAEIVLVEVLQYNEVVER